MKKYYMVGNTHFDPVWLWKWDEAMASIRATFRSALDRMNEDPDFIYSFATPPVFEWIKRVDPSLFEEIRARVKEGRWELAEGWWLQPDCYGASGESYVRHGLYAQRYWKENFDAYARCVFNIDSFGHSPMLPQILKKSGIDYYCFVRPEKHHIELEKPLFRWQSADGSEVMAYRAALAYEKDWHTSITAHTDADDALIVYGVTDHGGAPTKRAIAEIRADENALFSTVEHYFQTHTSEYAPDMELLTGDFGPYANYSKIKKLNRIAEYAVLNAERASLIAGKNENAALTACWKDILFNQFHDILGGACIKDAYFDAENMQGRAIASANEIMHYSLQSVTKNINTPGKNPDTIWNIVLWNLNGTPFEGYVEAEVQWVHEFDWYDKGICLEDENGVQYPCQIIREKSVIPAFRSRFAFCAKIPAMGYKVFKLVQTGADVVRPQVDTGCIQTKYLTVNFSQKTGCIESVTDRQTGETLCGQAFVPVCFSDKGDTWAFNIDGYENDPKYFTFEGFQVIESGSLLTELKGTYRLGHSLLELYYRFYGNAPYFDIRYRANWEEKHAVLKLETPVSQHRHTVAIPFGAVERDAASQDVPLGLWLQADKLSITSTGVFAYRMFGDSLGLTLLRSPIYGDLRIGPIDMDLDYDIIDRDIVEGSIRVSFQGDPWNMAEAFQNPPVVICESNHDGDLPASHSFCELRTEGVQLAAVKKCEDSDATIFRVVETWGRACTAQLSAQGQLWEFPLTPWEIKTLKLHGSDLETVNILEE